MALGVSACRDGTVTHCAHMVTAQKRGATRLEIHQRVAPRWRLHVRVAPSASPLTSEAAMLRRSLDHPVMFTLLITLCVLGWAALITWGAKKAGLNGLAALAQHP